jgi:hypothetical protein
MKKLIPIVLLIAIASHSTAAEPVFAKTADGRVIILSPDGTWKEFVNVPYDKKVFHGKNNKYKITYQPEKWTLKSENERGLDCLFHDKGENGFALVVSEKVEVPLSMLSDTIVAHMRKLATSAELINSEKIEISGYQFLKIRLRVTVENVDYIYYGYCGSGEWGTLQFLCYTSKNIFEEVRPIFDELLSGLEIKRP